MYVVFILQSLIWTSLSHVVTPLLVPHNCHPGYRVTSLPYWGQSFSLDEGNTEYVFDYFSVTSTGEIVTISELHSLLGQDVTLIIKNELASEHWTETVYIVVQDGHDMLQFTRQLYDGHISEKQSSGKLVGNLEDLYAFRGLDFDIQISYAIINVNEYDKLFYLSQSNDSSQPVKIFSSKILDRKEQNVYTLNIRASSGEEFTTATVTIHVDRDTQPKILASEYHVVISENTPAMSSITQIKTLETDSARPFTFHMKTHSLFKINSETGHIILRSRKLLEPLTYELHVYVKTADGQHSKSALVIVEVDQMEDETLLRYTPHIDYSTRSRNRRAVRATKKFEVKESLLGEIIRLADDSHERFSFTESPPTMLALNRETGVVKLKDGYRLDYEDQRSIHFSVIVTKTNNPEGKFFLNYYNYCYF